MNSAAAARDPATARRFGASRFWNVTAGAVAFVGSCLVLHVVLRAKEFTRLVALDFLKNTSQP
jgi:hypothetical protein